MPHPFSINTSQMQHDQFKKIQIHRKNSRPMFSYICVSPRLACYGVYIWLFIQICLKNNISVWKLVSCGLPAQLVTFGKDRVYGSLLYRIRNTLANFSVYWCSLQEHIRYLIEQDFIITQFLISNQLQNWPKKNSKHHKLYLFSNWKKI